MNWHNFITTEISTFVIGGNKITFLLPLLSGDGSAPKDDICPNEESSCHQTRLYPYARLKHLPGWRHSTRGTEYKIWQNSHIWSLQLSTVCIRDRKECQNYLQCIKIGKYSMFSSQCILYWNHDYTLRKWLENAKTKMQHIQRKELQCECCSINRLNCTFPDCANAKKTSAKLTSLKWAHRVLQTELRVIWQREVMTVRRNAHKEEILAKEWKAAYHAVNNASRYI